MFTSSDGTEVDEC